jgi:ABC-type iron transport system FetAB ATPase subunit
MQLHVASLQRIGIIVVGPSGCGKSVLWQVRYNLVFCLV